MGKLKFTLSNIWFWTALIGVTFLSQNLVVLTADMNSGHDWSSMMVLVASAAISLFMFFFINHRKNHMKVDWVLLPIIALLGICFLINIWTENGMTYEMPGSGGGVTVSFSSTEKIQASITLILYLSFIYGMLFMFSRTQTHSKFGNVALYIGIIFTYVAVIFSLITERASYLKIFDDTITSPVSIVSFFGNKNYYGGIIFVGILSCMIINYHRPRLIWYLTAVFFLLILCSTAAVLPTLIALVAVPLYLIIDIGRYIAKRRFVKLSYVTLTLLGVFALGIVFYLGAKLEWKGFKGVDIYITELMNSKDFNSLTGRTKIWEAVIPHCFDTLSHALFGHGYLITQKHTLGLTATVFGGFNVKTTHNGYIQVLFEFGVVGFAIHAILICYFLYGLIRLLLEKRVYFALIYGFVGLCIAAYNVAESSPIFYSGIKELYMTLVFILPVMSRAKLAGRKELIEETKNLPVVSNNMNHIALGGGIAGILMVTIATIIPLLTIQFTYSKPVLLELLVFVFVLLFVSLFIFPYLISLYYKNSQKAHFVLHCVFNGVFIFLPIFLLAVFLIHFHLLDTALWLCPSAAAFLIIGDMLVYTVIKNGSFREYAKVTFVYGMFEHIFAFIIAIIVGIFNYLMIQSFGTMNWFTYLFSLLIPITTFYMVLFLTPLKGARTIIDEYNNISLLHNKCATLKDDSYHG